MSAATGPRTKVGMISLGCAKNLVDAEIMLGSVLQRGMEITSRADEADVLVVNTCAFIDSAKEESIEAILEAHQNRVSKRPDQKLIVSGCMSQRFAREMHEQMPEVDVFMELASFARAYKVGSASMVRFAVATSAAARRPRLGARPFVVSDPIRRTYGRVVDKRMRVRVLL